MKILAVSDVELNMIYSPMIVQRFKDVDMIISCGDLPNYYLEYAVSMLDQPLYYIKGNHASLYAEEGLTTQREYPWGGTDLHKKVIRDRSGLLLAGIEGSLRYNQGPYQYTQGQMWLMAFLMVPKLMINRMLYGRFLDILVTHAPCWQIHDKSDLAHQGVKAFRWLVETFKPCYHLHGHIHIYQQYEPTETDHGRTRILNVYGYKQIEFEFPPRQKVSQ